MSYISTVSGTNIDAAISGINNMWLQIKVTGVDINSSITISKGDVTISGTSNTSGTYIFNVPSFGFWVVKAYKSGVQVIDTIYVNQVMQYTVMF